MKLQLLVPQYKEDENMVRMLLDSLVLQQGVDLNEVGVVIVNDGTDVKLSNEFIGSYPFKIKYVHAPHGGVSAARNVALQEAEADYVMFCDADDMFLNNCGVWLIFNEIEKGEFDAFISPFSEETYSNGKHNYINHPNTDGTFVHGKIYRRQFLLDKHIFWDKDLTIHEDSYFNYLARVNAAKDKLRLGKDVFYLWKYRPDSVCRTQKDWTVKSYTHMIKSTEHLVDELLRRGLMEYAKEASMNLIYRTYFQANTDAWNKDENREYAEADMTAFREYYKKYGPVADLLNEKKKKELWHIIREQAYKEGTVFMKFTFHDWIAQM